ncbi:MAG: hypothetical protein HY858_12055 [Candidatus Solibacter usitatus]|nr:hypothetical protein [Candidatus Solibacter usitatus]
MAACDSGGHTEEGNDGDEEQVGDIDAAQELAGKRGLPYQTYIKGLLHQALERERKAG